MTARSFILYSIVTAILVVAAIVAISSRPASTMIARDRALIFPGVDEKLNDVVSFEIKSADRTYTVKRTSNGWGIDELNGYIADFSKVKTVLVELAQMKFLEAKTSDPDRYERLNLRDVDVKGAKSRKITVVDKDGKETFGKYLEKISSYVGTIEDYPYPYVINRTCWEFPCAVPSDWEAQNLMGN